ncbi:MAG: phosphatase PAP2 family protein, partial [Acidimicrobiia bacterium]
FTGWVLGKVVKEVVERGRPQEFLANVNFRPEWEGLGFVSGHAAVAFAMAAMLSPYLSRPWKAVVWALAVATGIFRMYTAAHLPLDVTGGAGLGIAVAGLWQLATWQHPVAARN